MNTRQPVPDIRTMVVVPPRPGPLVDLHDLEPGHDEIDDLLDDVFGESDDRGPGPVDAVLVASGAGAVIAGFVASLPVIVIVGGFAALGLGVVLPLRSLWRGVASARRASRLRSLVGDGVLLRIDHPSVEGLLATQRRLLAVSASLATAPRGRVDTVAHAAVLEVAAMLGGRLPGAEAEMDYIAARTRALDELAGTVEDPRVGDGESDRRQALVEARREVEQLTGGTSLTDASDLARELLGSDGP